VAPPGLQHKERSVSISLDRVIMILRSNGYDVRLEHGIGRTRVVVKDPLEDATYVTTFEPERRQRALDQLLRDFATLDQRLEIYDGPDVPGAQPPATHRFVA